jgi:hypothetical protein
MAEISYTAQCALNEYGKWISEVLEEQMAEDIADASQKEYKRGRLDALNELKAYIREMGAYDTADTPQTETQTETQNSNLTFENRTMLDCYNCKRYKSD